MADLFETAQAILEESRKDDPKFVIEELTQMVEKLTARVKELHEAQERGLSKNIHKPAKRYRRAVVKANYAGHEAGWNKQSNTANPYHPENQKHLHKAWNDGHAYGSNKSYVG